MQTVVQQFFGTAAVAMIYVIYGAYREHQFKAKNRHGVLRERVAYMLWVMADQIH